MANNKFLDNNGLLYFWQKIKTLFALKSELPGVVSKTAPGLAPQLPNETTTAKFLRQDGTWVAPPNSQRSPATVAPPMDGTAAVGTSAKYAREDHVHPTDTSRASAADLSALSDTVGNKVDKVSGKGLSTNDFTTALKNKLDGIAAGAQVNVIETVKRNGTALAVTDKAVDVEVPEVSYGSATPVAGTPGSGEVHIDPGEIYLKFGSIPVATQSADGLMSAADKTKLDGFQAASNYALKSEISGAYRYKGSVATASQLPTTGNQAGDVWNIEAASTYGEAGTNVAWTGSAWDSLGSVWQITAITNAEIDAIVAA